MFTILFAAGYLLAALVLMQFLEPGLTPPGFTGHGAYALILIFAGSFQLAGRWRSTIPFMIFGAVASALLLPNYLGDRRLQFRLGDSAYSPEIWAATIGWCIFVISVSLLVRMVALVRWRLIQNVPREHPACRNCRYDLWAAEKVCPECGTPFDRQDPGSFLATEQRWNFRWLRRRVVAIALFAVLPLAGIYGFFYLRSDSRPIAEVENTGG